jgi:hypothetical protein
MMTSMIDKPGWVARIERSWHSFDTGWCGFKSTFRGDDEHGIGMVAGVTAGLGITLATLVPVGLSLLNRSADHISSPTELTVATLLAAAAVTASLVVTAHQNHSLCEARLAYATASTGRDE